MTSPRGHASKRRVTFIPDSEVDHVVVTETLPLIKLHTPPCVNCNLPSVLELTAAEFKSLVEDIPIEEAMPDRSASFREHVVTGLHPVCWQEMMSALGITVEAES